MWSSFFLYKSSCEANCLVLWFQCLCSSHRPRGLHVLLILVNALYRFDTIHKIWFSRFCSYCDPLCSSPSIRIWFLGYSMILSYITLGVKGRQLLTYYIFSMRWRYRVTMSTCSMVMAVSFSSPPNELIIDLPPYTPFHMSKHRLSVVDFVLSCVMSEVMYHNGVHHVPAPSFKSVQFGSFCFSGGACFVPVQYHLKHKGVDLRLVIQDASRYY